MPTTITLNGWKEFETKLKTMPETLQKEIGGEVEDAARLWAAGAKNDAPVDQGFLRGLITSAKIGPMMAEATSPADYSAYIEWGTRSRVRVPSDLQAYALQFKSAGAGGVNPKFFIYAWCKRKGIPEKAWYPIFISIMVRGIRPHPFFFIQVPVVEKQLINNVKNILNTEH